MNIFQKKIVKEALSIDDFIDFIQTISSVQKFEIDKLLKLPWKDYQKMLGAYIIKSLQIFSTLEDSSIPHKGLKGLYFSLADDGSSLDISGSLYYNETD